MNKTFVVISFLFFISVFTISPVWGLEDRIIISEIDGNLFSAMINSTIIMVNGNAIQKFESINPDQIGKIFIFEEKNKESDSWKFVLTLIFGIISGVIAIFGAIFGAKKYFQQRQDSLDLEFSKTLIDFEKQWSNARTSWKDKIPEEIKDENKQTVLNTCIALCSKRLSVLDSLAFLSMSKKIDERMLEFFHFHFTEGLLYDNWLNQIDDERANPTQLRDPSYPHFTLYVEDHNNIEIASIENLDDEFLKVFQLITSREFRL